MRCPRLPISRLRRATLLGSLVLTASALQPPAPVAAQGIAFGLAPEASRIRWDDGLGLEEGTFWGGRGIFEFGRYVSLQAAYGRADGLQASFAGTDFAGFDNRVDAEIASTAVVLRLGSGTFVPLVSGTGGLLRLRPDGRPVTDEIFVGWGGGLGVRLGDHVEANFLLHQTRARLDRSRYAAPGVSIDDPDGSALRRQLYGSVGVGIRLGGIEDDARSSDVDRRFEGVLRGEPEGLMVPIEARGGMIRFDDALDLEDEAIVGVRTGFDFGPWFGLRGGWFRGVGSDENVDFQGWSGEAQFNVGRVTSATPFLLLGYGRLDFDDDARTLSGEVVPDQDAVIVGAGFGLPLFTDRARLTVALRDYMTTSGDLAVPSAPSDIRHSFALEGGLSLRLFGGGDDSETMKRPETGRMAARDTMAADMPAADERMRAEQIADSVSERTAKPEAEAGEPRPDSTMRARTRTAAADSMTSAAADSTARGYHSERTITIPIPTEGELYIRYGPPSDARRGPQFMVDSTAATGSTGTIGADALEAAIRAELDRMSGDSTAAPALRALQLRIEELADRVERGGVTGGDDAVSDLERRVAELSDIVRESISRRSESSTSTGVYLLPDGTEVPSDGSVAVPDAGGPFVQALEGRLGTYTFEDAGLGVGLAGDVLFGNAGNGFLQPFAGLEWGRGSVARRAGPVSVSGSVSQIVGKIGARARLPQIGPVRPAASVALGAIAGSVSGDSPQDSELLDDLYDGGAVGFEWGLHVALGEETDRLRLIGSLSRLSADERSRWALQAGVRWMWDPSGQVMPSRAETMPTPPTSRPGPVERELLDRLENLESAIEAESAAREARADSLRSAAAAADSARGQMMQREMMQQEGMRQERMRQERMRQERMRQQDRMQQERMQQVAVAVAIDRASAVEVAALHDALTALAAAHAVLDRTGETDRGLEIVVGGDAFAVGSAFLATEARAAVSAVAELLRDHPGFEILVEGHTDATGAARANLALSEERAAAVRSILLSAGLAPGRVEAIGSGEADPVAPNDTAEGREMNRRVEIVLVGVGTGG